MMHTPRIKRNITEPVLLLLFKDIKGRYTVQLVKQQGLDAERWDGLMDWMTKKQGMPALGPEDEARSSPISRSTTGLSPRREA